MITLSPVAVNIQNTLNEKIRMLKKSSGGTLGDSVAPNTEGNSSTDYKPDWKASSYSIGTPLTDSAGLEQNYMFTRTPWIKVTSLLPFGEPPGTPIILQGGELDKYNELKGGFRETHTGPTWGISTKGQGPGMSIIAPISNETGNDYLRPMPGVKDINVEYKGGGMKLGATRTAEISWVCWSWEELDRLTPHFLQHGKTIMLEWGWSGIGKLNDIQTIDIYNDPVGVPHGGRATRRFDPDKIDKLQSTLSSHTTEQKGHMEVMLGIIQNFDWKVNDTGGFDCSTTIVAPGKLLLQKHQKAKTEISKLPLLAAERPAGAMEAKTFGGVMRGVFGFLPGVEQTEQVVVATDGGKTMPELVPYITFKEYMLDFPYQLRSNWLAGNTGGWEKAGISLLRTYSIEDYVHYKFEQADAVKVVKKIIVDNKEVTSNLEMKDLSNEERLAIQAGGGEATVTNAGQTYTFAIQNKDSEQQTWTMLKAVKIGAVNKPGTGLSQTQYPTIFASGELQKKMGGNTQNFLPYSLIINQIANGSSYGDPEFGNMYCSWGWFEDNVLSRFWGQIGKKKEHSRTPQMLNEFRSIEHMQDDQGTLQFISEESEDGRAGAPIYESTMIRNSPFLVTMDTLKWLIPNMDDPIMKALEKNGMTYFVRNTLARLQEDSSKYIPFGSVERKDGVGQDLKYGQSWSRIKKDAMPIRNIMFHPSYLKEKFKETTDIISGVESFWNEFSSAYGGVYKFKVEYDDIGQRMMVKEEGYTKFSVNRLLETKEKDRREEPVSGQPKLFEFPVWEDGSIVKTQTLQAKLPDRMQVAAMYGYGDHLGKEEKSSKDGAETEGENNSSSPYDELIGRAWGNFVKSQVSQSYEEQDKVKEARYHDMLHGPVDTPSRGNREFGRIDSDQSKLLYIGDPAVFNPDGGVKSLAQKGTTGTWIDEHIKGILSDRQKEYFAKYREEHPEDIPETKLEEMMKNNEGTREAVNAFAHTWYAAKLKWEINTFHDKWSAFYDFILHPYEFVGNVGLDEAKLVHSIDIPDLKHEAYANPDVTMSNKYSYYSDVGVLSPGNKYMEKHAVGFLRMKENIQDIIGDLMRTDLNGVLRKVEPLVPIEFEIDIDGTGGIYPGNSFHSSYLPQRYQDNCLFQVIASDHTIDSSGWTTTIKGQIRARSRYDEIQREKEDKPEPKPKPKVTISPGTNGDEIKVPDAVEEVEMKSTFRGYAWQNNTIYGLRSGIDDSEPDWIPTLFHHPEWQPQFLFSDGIEKPYEKKQVLQADNTYKEEDFIENTVKAKDKSIRKAYWDEHIEPPNATGESVGVDGFYNDCLCAI